MNQDNIRASSEDTHEPTDQPVSRRGVTLRAVLLALILFPFNAYWIIIMECARYQGHPTTISLFYNVVFILLVLCLLNLMLRKWAPRWAFSPGELMTVYVLLCIGSVAASHDRIQVLAPIMTYAYYFASPENGWDSLILPNLPDWLTMHDPQSLKNMHWGDANFLDPANFGPWLAPAAWWTAFAVALWMVCLAFASIFQRRWIHSERLTFPIVMLPLEMVAERSRAMPEGFFRNRAMWLAFGLALGLDILNGLHTLHPTWPALSVSPRANPNLNLVTQLLDRPWNAIGFAPVSFYPFVIGLGLLLPVELAQSCVIFFWFWKMELVAGAWLGQNVMVGFPFVEEQEFGGYAAVTAFFLWSSRGYIKRVWQEIIKPPPKEEREGEGMPHRTAAIIILLGTIFLVGFSMKAGMPLWMAVVFFIIYYIISLAVGRVRAEMGMPAHDIHFAGPDQMLVNVLGSRNFQPRALAINSMYWWFNRAFRSHILPHQAEGYKVAQRTGADRKWMTVAMTAAIVVALPVAFWAMLQASYKYGMDAEMVAGKGFGYEPMSKLAAWLSAPTDPNPHRAAAIVIGFVFLFSMMVLKTRVGWWPLHPVGYAVSASWSMQFLWCPLLIASSAKMAITRYGGHKAMHNVVPFAFGMILGDLTGGSFWTLYSIWKEVTVYSIWQ